MNKNEKRSQIIILTFTALCLAAFVLFAPEESTLQAVEDFVVDAGRWAPFAIIGGIVVEVVLAPVPGYPIPIVAGALLGIVPGFLVSWIGNVLGAFLAFGIARLISDSVLQRLIKPEKFAYYNSLITQHQNALWVLYALPIFPIDIISFAAGVSSLRWRRFATIVVVAFIPNMLLLSILGGSLFMAEMWQKTIIAIVFFVVVAIALQVRKRHIEKLTQ